MGTEEWPPPMTSGEAWQKVVTLDRDGERVPVRVRRARLWGQRVQVDASGRVFCDGCCQMLDVASLTQPGHGHRVGLHRGRLNLPLTPMPTGPMGDTQAADVANLPTFSGWVDPIDPDQPPSGDDAA